MTDPAIPGSGGAGHRDRVRRRGHRSWYSRERVLDRPSVRTPRRSPARCAMCRRFVRDPVSGSDTWIGSKQISEGACRGGIGRSSARWGAWPRTPSPGVDARRGEGRSTASDPGPRSCPGAIRLGADRGEVGPSDPADGRALAPVERRASNSSREHRVEVGIEDDAWLAALVVAVGGDRRSSTVERRCRRLGTGMFGLWSSAARKVTSLRPT